MLVTFFLLIFELFLWPSTRSIIITPLTINSLLNINLIPAVASGSSLRLASRFFHTTPSVASWRTKMRPDLNTDVPAWELPDTDPTKVQAPLRPALPF